MERRGRYSRGYIPHLDIAAPQFLTWRLADAVPAETIEKWREELAEEPETIRRQKLARQIEAYADVGYGSCLLREPRVARVVQETFFHDHGRAYDLLAWVVMPNHVHVVLTPREGIVLARIVQSMKGVSAKRINAVCGEQGQRWQADYFDRAVRDEEHFARLVRYIEWNPVKAGLCADPSSWAWSSANGDAWLRLRALADNRSADASSAGGSRTPRP